MPGRKKAIGWTDVGAGDFISFKYKSRRTGRLLTQSILVLNPKMPVRLKKDIKEPHKQLSSFHLIGIKVEESNKPMIRERELLWKICHKIGELWLLDPVNDLYKVLFTGSMLDEKAMGTKDDLYDKFIKTYPRATKYSPYYLYRTYDWSKAVKFGTPFLEPVLFPKRRKLQLIEERKVIPKGLLK
jgi:hypothetical protein